jgi:hypothetical protein
MPECHQVLQISIPKIAAWSALIGVVLLLVSACTSHEAFVQRDVAALAEQDLGGNAHVEIVEAGVGESDADHMYYQIDLNLVARRDFSIELGLFKGFRAKKGVSYSCRVEFLYARRNGEWRLAHRSVLQKPAPT